MQKTSTPKTSTENILANLSDTQSTVSSNSSNGQDSELHYAVVHYGSGNQGEFVNSPDPLNFEPYEPVILNDVHVQGEKRKISNDEKLIHSYLVQSCLPEKKQQQLYYQFQVKTWLKNYFPSHFQLASSSNFTSTDTLVLRPLPQLNLNYFKLSSFRHCMAQIVSLQLDADFRETQAQCLQQLSYKTDTTVPFTIRFKHVESKLGTCISRILKHYLVGYVNPQALLSITMRNSLEEPISPVQTYSLFRYLGRTTYFMIDMKHFLLQLRTTLYDELKFLFTEVEVGQVINIIFKYAFLRHLMHFDLNMSFEETLNYYFMDSYIQYILPTKYPLQAVLLAHKPSIVYFIKSLYMIMMREHYMIKQSRYTADKHAVLHGTLV